MHSTTVKHIWKELTAQHYEFESCLTDL